jgi:DNA-binding NtrC family response regulator
MPGLWIVHREPALRAALARLAAAPDDVQLGAPGDALFDAAPTPHAVVLGLAADLESELEFVHRVWGKLPYTAWFLVGDPARIERGRLLFDTLPASFLVYPPEVRAFRDALREAADAPDAEPLPLSQRAPRDALAQRFARTFADLELPELLHAIDPRRVDVPLLALGEPGTGRATLVRYVHHFGATAGGALVDLECRETTRSEQLLERIAAARSGPGNRRACTLWLREPQRLAPALQHELSGWIDYGLPPGTTPARLVRWIGSAAETGLEPALRRSLGGLTARVPPLRARPGLVANLANTTALAWCSARGQRPRRLGEHALAILEEYPWPGNLRELEAVLEQSLAASGADPLGPEDLVLDGEAFAPLDAGDFGTLLEEVPEPAEPPQEALRVVLDDATEQLEALGSSVEAAPEPPDEQLARPPEPGREDEGSLRRLAAAVGHELRNPLTAVRALAELLPERHADSEFRTRFTQLAADGLMRADDVLARLEQLAAFPRPSPRAIDVGALIEEVLDKRREQIRERRLVVLEELDRQRPQAHADPDQLRFALEALLDKSLELVPERGDVYLASRRHPAGMRGGPCVRVLLRYRGAEHARSPQFADTSPAANALDFAIAELLIRAQGGVLTLDASDRNETVIVIDLPA